MQANTTATAHGAVQAKSAGVHATTTAKASIVATVRNWSAALARAKAKVGPAMKAKASVVAGAKAGAAPSSGTSSSGTSAAGGASNTGSVNSAAMGHAKIFGSVKGLKIGLGARLSGIVKTGPVAVKGSLVVKGLVAVGVALAGLAVAAHTGDVSGAQATISALPTWTSGQSILAHVQAGLSGGGSGGSSIQLGF
jgi:hypothetical protein